MEDKFDVGILVVWFDYCFALTIDFSWHLENICLLIELSLTQNYRLNHVSSIDSPADLFSQGVLPLKLIKSNLWWFGPSWLSRNDSVYPLQKITVITNEIPEKRNIK